MKTTTVLHASTSAALTVAARAYNDSVVFRTACRTELLEFGYDVLRYGIAAVWFTGIYAVAVLKVLVKADWYSYTTEFNTQQEVNTMTCLQPAFTEQPGEVTETPAVDEPTEWEVYVDWYEEKVIPLIEEMEERIEHAQAGNARREQELHDISNDELSRVQEAFTVANDYTQAQDLATAIINAGTARRNTYGLASRTVPESNYVVNKKTGEVAYILNCTRALDALA